MDEARRVLERLERIERLDRRDVTARELLGELRALVGEAETWLRAEAGAGRDAATAVGALRAALERPASERPGPTFGKEVVPLAR